MKISEMIKNLQEFMAEHGDLECWYAVDDEGNAYREVYYEPSLYYVNEDGEVYQEIDDFDLDEVCIDELRHICIIN